MTKTSRQRVNYNARNLLISFVIVAAIGVFGYWGRFFNFMVADQWPYTHKVEGRFFEFDINLSSLDLERKVITYKVTAGGPYKSDDARNEKCFSQAFFIEFENPDSNSEKGGSDITVFRDGCATATGTASKNQKSIDDQRAVETNIVYNRTNFPYDNIIIDVAVDVGKFDDIGPVGPSVNWSLDFPGWDLKSAKDIRQPDVTRTIITLQRPIQYRFLVPILIICSTVLILSCLFINDIASLTQLVSGMLFGLFGIRQTIIPPDIKSTTNLDLIIVLLYSLLSALFAIKVYIINRRKVLAGE